MKEYIIRNKSISCISSRVLQVFGEDISLENAAADYGRDFVLRELFLEELTYSELIHAFQAFSPDNSSFFSKMYEISPGYGLVLDAHITLCYFDTNYLAQQQAIFPWIYVSSQKYLGDTWWFENQEIINDIKQLSTIDFLRKYKGV